MEPLAWFIVITAGLFIVGIAILIFKLIETWFKSEDDDDERL